MQSNTAKTSNYDLVNTTPKKHGNLALFALCCSFTGLFGLIGACNITQLSMLPISKVLIFDLSLFLSIFSIPGCFAGWYANFNKPPHRAGFWAMLLGLFGVVNLPTMIFAWIHFHYILPGQE